MIISCPACGKRYQLADSAIGPEGRKVRCAACGETWHAAPPPPAAAEPAPAPEPEPIPPPPPPAARAAETPRPPQSWGREPPLRPRRDPEPPEPAPAPRFAATPPPGREGLRWAAAGIAAAVLILLMLMMRPGGFAGVDLGARLEPRQPGSAVRLTVQPPIWGEVIDGRTLLTVLGTAENPAPVPVRMPALDVEVLAADGRRVAGWRERPGPALPPRSAIAFETTGFEVPDDAALIRIAYAEQR